MNNLLLKGTSNDAGKQSQKFLTQPYDLNLSVWVQQK